MIIRCLRNALFIAFRHRRARGVGRQFADALGGEDARFDADGDRMVGAFLQAATGGGFERVGFVAQARANFVDSFGELERAGGRFEDLLQHATDRIKSNQIDADYIEFDVRLG